MFDTGNNVSSMSGSSTAQQSSPSNQKQQQKQQQQSKPSDTFNREAKDRLCQRTQTFLEELNSLTRSLLKNSRSSELLLQSAKSTAALETTVLQTSATLNRVALVTSNLALQTEAIGSDLAVLDEINDQVVAVSSGKRPNILVTGTPGTGKSTLCQELANRLASVTHVCVGEVAKANDYFDGWDEATQCHFLDEDRLLDDLEERLADGGCVVDYHSAELFPERWFQAVFVLRTENSLLYQRLKARNYAEAKVQQNVQCEIFQTLLEEARESYKPEIIFRIRTQQCREIKANRELILMRPMQLSPQCPAKISRKRWRNDDDSDSDGAATPPPTLAATRERRAKAGSRMARLLNELDGGGASVHQQLRRATPHGDEAGGGSSGGGGDDFYETVYGGFAETASDADYEEESSESDQVDSDFDIGEGGAGGGGGGGEGDDDEGSDGDDDEESTRRRGGQRRRLVTKAYKEPVRPTAAAGPPPAKRGRKSAAANAAAAAASSDANSTRATRRGAAAAAAGLKLTATAARERRSREARASAVASVAATAAAATAGRRPRQSTSSTAGQGPGRRRSAASNAANAVRRLTQEELLAEAQLTEQVNLRSLARYQRLEVEKKKARSRQPVARGPTVRFDSYTTRLLDEDVVPVEVTEVNTDTGDTAPKPTLVLEPDNAPNRRCTRNFVSFTHQETLAAGLSLNRRPPMRNPFCPISNQPARYFDPLTQTPYRDARSFRVLRTLYAMHHATGIRPAVLLKQYTQGELIV
uniref:Adenylate kinase isoenzyme 6 homolog n=1 Tax=Macrostomum lignano TaxID=282301 RepID=A0A1I8JMI9_9PLAT